MFRSHDSLSTELAQHETDIYCQEGLIPENADSLEYEEYTKMYIQDSMTRGEIVDRLQETRKRVWH